VEHEKERTIRMANILGFTVDKRMDVKSILTRGALLSSINSMNLLGQVGGGQSSDSGGGQ
jgi:translation initiation factor 3 subunit A